MEVPSDSGSKDWESDIMCWAIMNSVPLPCFMSVKLSGYYFSPIEILQCACAHICTVQ